MPAYSVESMLERMRSSGWRVGAHNDFFLERTGEWKVYWMFTHPRTGRYVEMENVSDEQAVHGCMKQAKVRGF